MATAPQTMQQASGETKESNETAQGLKPSEAYNPRKGLAVLREAGGLHPGASSQGLPLLARKRLPC